MLSFTCHRSNPAYTEEARLQNSNSSTVCGLQNGYCFPSTLHISQDSPWGFTPSGNIQKRKFWETYVSLAKLTHYKATAEDG